MSDDHSYRLLEMKDARIAALEAALRKACEYLEDFKYYGFSVQESQYIRDWLADTHGLLGSTPETACKHTSVAQEATGDFYCLGCNQTLPDYKAKIEVKHE